MKRLNDVERVILKNQVLILNSLDIIISAVCAIAPDYDKWIVPKLAIIEQVKSTEKLLNQEYPTEI